MKTMQINGILREKTGKKDTKKLRKEEMVPCVLYNEDKNIHFAATEKELKKIIYTPHVYIVALNIDNKEYKAIVQDSQFHPLTDKTLHMDFLPVYEDKKVEIEIPVRLVGLPEGVKEGGKLSLISRRLKVKGLAKDLLDELVVDVEHVELGKSVKVGELNFENLELMAPKDMVVASVKTTRIAKGMELDEDLEEGAVEGEEGEGTGEGEEEKSEE